MAHRFTITTIPTPMGQLAIGPVPVASADWAELARWNPAVIVTLLEKTEMTQLGVADLPDEARAIGADWQHLPIQDFGIPIPAQTADWARLQDQLLQGLRAQSRVFIHCRGGCGRSGMIALRLMRGMGLAGPAALADLRGARPCAIETDDQMDWALGGP